ncbi:hypothetical protein WJX72_000308 [[Myrmecia] bisecta]|uniref:Multidrug and toxic compound extrusion protein n=1 Tax=[Myrmecia] bisecta TaxID=41462 RepID=A0AAW1Q3Y0_9CHLO
MAADKAREGDEEAAAEPLLTPTQDEHSASTGQQDQRRLSTDSAERTVPVIKTPGGSLLQEVQRQGVLAGPLIVNLMLNYSLSIISLSFVGHIGTAALAAAAMSTTVYSATGKLVLMGLAGALDTQASQAFGSGNFAALPVILQRCVYFLLLHCAPLTVAFMSVPAVLRALGQEAQLCNMVAVYTLGLLPSLWLDAINRPLNRILVAQRITMPQMCISGIVALLHLAGNYLFIHVFNFGYRGAAYAMSLANLNNLLLTGAYVVLAGKQNRVWGVLTAAAFKDWVPFARLAYPSCLMKCVESWSFSLMTLVAGLLPDPDSAVAAIAVAFNLYGILFMAFVSVSIAVTVRVGNALGAGQAGQARLAANAAAVSTPLIWAVVAVILIEPHTQALLLSVFTNGQDAELLSRMRRLLYLVVVLELFDGAQTVMQGVIQGSGSPMRQ